MLVVSDANIFIDLGVGGLTKDFFELEWTVIVPDALFQVELSDLHEGLLELGLERRL